MNWVVVVDDEDYNRKTVSRILSKHGFMVTTLESGEKLLDYIIVQKNKPDLILLDIVMPEPEAVSDCDIPAAILNLAELECEKGIEYCGDEDDYLFALETYSDSVAEKANQLEKCLKEERYGDYAMIMHSLKSMSKSIGAVALSDLAKELEQSAKAGDTQDLKNRAFSFIESYRSLGQKISDGLK